MNEINKPSVRTYWISFDNDRTEVIAYNYVEPYQVFRTIYIIDEFTDEQQWLDDLAKWGITPEFDEQGNLLL